MAMGHEQRNNSDSRVLPGYPEHDSRRRVSSNKGLVLLDVGSTGIPIDTGEVGSTRLEVGTFASRVTTQLDRFFS